MILRHSWDTARRRAFNGFQWIELGEKDFAFSISQWISTPSSNLGDLRRMYARLLLPYPLKGLSSAFARTSPAGSSCILNFPCSQATILTYPQFSLELNVMKRVNGFATLPPQRKAKQTKSKPRERDYCDVEPPRDENGTIIWPAKVKDIERARIFIRDW